MPSALRVDDGGASTGTRNAGARRCGDGATAGGNDGGRRDGETGTSTTTGDDGDDAAMMRGTDARWCGRLGR